MTWSLQGIILPIPPAKMSKRTTRENKIIATIEDFPNPNLNQPTKFELDISGLLWPRALAQSLDEACKSAEENTFRIYLGGTDLETKEWITGDYAVTRADINTDKPRYTNVNDEVFDYQITFTKYASAGSRESAEEGGGNDNGVGTNDLKEDLGFDKNGDGDIDADELFNWFTNILTFGVFK